MLVMFSLFVDIPVHATSILLWKTDVEAKDVWLHQYCFQKAKREYHSVVGKGEIFKLLSFFRRTSRDVFLYYQKLFSQFIL